MTDKRALDRLFAGFKLDHKKTEAKGKKNNHCKDSAESKAKKDSTLKKSQPKKSAKGKQPQGGSLAFKENDLPNKYCALPLGRVQTPGKEGEIAWEPQAEEQTRTNAPPQPLLSAEAQAVSHPEHCRASTPVKEVRLNSHLPPPSCSCVHSVCLLESNYKQPTLFILDHTGTYKRGWLHAGSRP